MKPDKRLNGIRMSMPTITGKQQSKTNNAMKPDERLNGIRMYTAGMSKYIQEIAFERGYVNSEGKQEVANTDAPFLYFLNGKISYGYNMEEYTTIPNSLLRSMDAVEFVKKFMSFGLKPFQKVLVRDSDEDIWRCDFFSHIEEDTHRALSGSVRCDKTTKRYVCVTSDYEQCIQYEGNEHLLGTDDKPGEKRIANKPISEELERRLLRY